MLLELSDIIWNHVKGWDYLAQKTVGVQLIRSADSIGANLSEGFGRFYYKENKLFCYYARGSLEETKHWLRLAYKRGLIDKESTEKIQAIFSEFAPKLNSYINTTGKTTAEE